MTPREVSLIVGCSTSQIRNRIRKGQILHTQRSSPGGGFSYDITEAEAERLRLEPQKQGWPRGLSRAVPNATE